MDNIINPVAPFVPVHNNNGGSSSSNKDSGGLQLNLAGIILIFWCPCFSCIIFCGCSLSKCCHKEYHRRRERYICSVD